MGKIEIRVFCKTTKEKKPTLLENKPGKIKEKITQKQRKPKINQVENLKEKRNKNKISSMGYFQVELQEKKCLYKKKIEKSSKICLCMIKKNFLPHIQKKIPQKTKSP